MKPQSTQRNTLGKSKETAEDTERPNPERLFGSFFIPKYSSVYSVVSLSLCSLWLFFDNTTKVRRF